MMFTSAKQASALLLLLSSLSTCVLAGQSPWKTMKQHTVAAVNAAETATKAHFRDVDKEFRKLNDGEKWHALNSESWQDLYKNPSKTQTAHYKAHMDRDDQLEAWENHWRNRDDHYRATKAAAYRDLNGLVGKYASAYPFNHMDEDGSETDWTELHKWDDQVKNQKQIIKNMTPKRY